METTSPIEQELLSCMAKLPMGDQQRVMDFAQALAATTGFGGVRGSALRRFAGTISREEAEEMRKAIEEGCEQIDVDRW